MSFCNELGARYRITKNKNSRGRHFQINTRCVGLMINITEQGKASIF